MKTLLPCLAAATLLIPMAPSARGHDAPKMASVDMQKLFKEYHRTGEAQEQMNGERAKIQKGNNERLQRMRELTEEVREMQARLEDPAVTEKRKQSTRQELQAKMNEGAALDKERTEFLERRNKRLNENMVQQMQGILGEIAKLVEETGKAKGYQVVIDSSGLSTAQVPFLLYSELDDLTPEMLAALNKDAPKEEE